ncbi:ABC transporter substrate-binding protein [Sphaerisporangium fuscum]|uniref:ABC transporter substrate-binding protein n=1 Tax=Sphaerisporangium fuscum TaxID=2835868 RepID=UPI001BDD4E7B|nr:ABC transporter substrate-binding protein [Sphaerisporangium fuscum]
MRSLRGRTFVVGLASILALAACGGGSDKGSSESGTGGLEKTTINVATLPIADVAGLFIAEQKGFFKQEGLTIKTEMVQSTGFALPKLQSGATDVALGSYFTILSAVGNSGQQYRYVADGYQAKNEVFDIVVKKDSPIKSVKDLKGKKVAIPAPNSIGEMAVSNALRTAGLNPVPNTDVQMVPMAFPQVPAAIQNGTIDAGWLTEPFLTGAQKDLGIHSIQDTMTGSMSDFPISGWAVTENWAKKYPKTMAAFQRALLKGQQVAAADRKAVEAVLPGYSGIKPEVAGVITLGIYPTSLNATRIQRVADLMLEFKYLKQKLDVNSLLVPLPQ